MQKASDKPKLLPDILGILNDEDEKEISEGVDKAATPAERLRSTAALERELDRQRPLCRMAQRDSDANKEVKRRREEACAQFTDMKLATSSTFAEQFLPSYLPRVFHIAVPYLVGGPDIPRRARPRRGNDKDAEWIYLNRWVKLAASNCLTRFRWD